MVDKHKILTRPGGCPPWSLILGKLVVYKTRVNCKRPVSPKSGQKVPLNYLKAYQWNNKLGLPHRETQTVDFVRNNYDHWPIRNWTALRSKINQLQAVKSMCSPINPVIQSAGTLITVNSIWELKLFHSLMI